MEEKIKTILRHQYPDKYEEMHEQTAELICALLDVVGRSEQYHCELHDFGRKDKPCDKQCDGCKEMNLD